MRCFFDPILFGFWLWQHDTPSHRDPRLSGRSSRNTHFQKSLSPKSQSRKSQALTLKPFQPQLGLSSPQFYCLCLYYPYRQEGILWALCPEVCGLEFRVPKPLTPPESLNPHGPHPYNPEPPIPETLKP